MSKTVDPATTHRWVGAATIPLSPQQAKTADLRGSFVVKADSRITVVEAYCGACRRPYDDCADHPCAAADSRTNEHLRGGPIGERKKRLTGDSPAPPPPARHPAPLPRPVTVLPRPVTTLPVRPVASPAAAAPAPPARTRPTRRRGVPSEDQLNLLDLLEPETLTLRAGYGPRS